MHYSDGLGIEKVGFGRVRVFPNFEMSGSGITGMEKFRFGRIREKSGSGIETSGIGYFSFYYREKYFKCH